MGHELLEYRYMDDVTGNLFNLFCSKWRAVLKILVRLFRIKHLKASKKAKQELFTKRKNGERETKRVLDNLRKLKLQEIFTTVAIASCVIATRDSLFCKMFSPLFWFEQEKTLKKYSKKLYASKIKKKGEAETKSSDWDSKNALTNTNLRTVKSYEAGMCIGLFSFLNIVMYRFSQG